MPDRDDEIPADEATFTSITGTFDTTPDWGAPFVADRSTLTFDPGPTAKPWFTIAAGGSPIEISSADTALCRIELGADRRWTAVYDPADVDEAARAFLDAVTSVGLLDPLGWTDVAGPISPDLDDLSRET